jgi:hypothetical protein
MTSYHLPLAADARLPNLLQPVLQPSLIRTGTQWTKRLCRIIENRLNTRDFRTPQDRLERVQANS